MNEKDMLNLFQETDDAYIADAVKSRTAVVYPRKRMMSAAAAIALVCMLLGCGVAYAHNAGWFLSFFNQRSREPLTAEQIQQIGNQEILVGESQIQNGWNVELSSIMSDGSMGYVLFRVTAPEGVDLGAKWTDGVMESVVRPGNIGPVVSASDPDCLGTYAPSWVDDTDGLSNTCSLILEILPNCAANKDPLGADVTWNICLDGLVRETENVAYRWELANGKYKGQSSYQYTEEEIKKLTTREVLTEGTWEFSVNFVPAEQGTQWVELLQEPIWTVTELMRRTGVGTEYETSEVVKDALRITSIRLNSLSVSVVFDYDDAVFLDIGPGGLCVVMQDGTKVEFKSATGGPGYLVFKATAPIVIENAQYLILPDGTQIEIA